MKSKIIAIIIFVGVFTLTAACIYSATDAQTVKRRTGRAVTAGVKGNASPAKAQVIRITARDFAFSPGTITVKKGVPVTMELTSADRKHGFGLRAFGVRTEVTPGNVSRVSFTPDRTGRFTFSCDVFCGDGHEEMMGTLIVTE